jgi:hypothetical protein
MPAPAYGTKQNALVPKLAGDTLPKAKPPAAPSPTGAVPVPDGVLTSTAPAGAPPAPAASPTNRPPTPETLTPPGGAIPAPTTSVPVPGMGAPNTAPTLTPTDPNNPLTGQTIAPGAGVDRFALAMDRFDQFAKGSDPAYQAALRDANRYGAANGRLGSGMLRTSFGDLANQRSLALDTEKRGLLSDAIEGTVGDARFATGVAQQQQGFQSGQQQQAFENELRRLGFDDDLLNSAFGRALMQWQAGNTGGTGSGTILTGAGQAGDTGRDAMSALDAWLAERARTQGRLPGSPATPAGVTFGGGVTRPPGSV